MDGPTHGAGRPLPPSDKCILNKLLLQALEDLIEVRGYLN
jgi:hypothetical protein